MKSLYLFIGMLSSCTGFAQPALSLLNRAVAALEADPRFQHAVIGLCVTSKTGSIVFEKNADMGMAPASVQKVIVSVGAFELLGRDYRFKTDVAIDGQIKDKVLNGNLFFIGGGDPTFGSSRWPATKENIIIQKVKRILEDNNIKEISGEIKIDEKDFLYPPVPNGWVWEDLGNYYGAAAWGLNWMENKYAVHLCSVADSGKPTRVTSTYPPSLAKQISNHILSAARGSGDNAYLFSAPYSHMIFANGTIPAGEKDFIIYGAMPEPSKIFVEYANQALTSMLRRKNIPSLRTLPEIIGTIYSPTLDSVNHWFLKESVNLFGEALIKNIAISKREQATTRAGVEALRNFWSENGIPKSALKIIDGSGLSPSNRITPKALVQALKFATTRPWFASFFHALPEINGIKMKSGYIGGVRSFAGYIKSKTGEDYTFAFIINNFDGSAAEVRQKMYHILNLLK